MFSSVRYHEHVRNAVNIGVHTITVTWKVMKNLTENNFTTLGTNQFFEHTKLMTVKVKDILSNKNPIVSVGDTVMDAIVKMTESGFGCVSVVENDNSLKGAFTDGDLRRLIENEGNGILQKSMGDLTYGTPITIEGEALLNEAQEIFHNNSVDNIIVLHDGEVAGILDIQDLS
jgi:signal-transduction protein with cAMP-binding, CBS, and nucleotidyltransferase domain